MASLAGTSNLMKMIRIDLCESSSRRRRPPEVGPAILHTAVAIDNSEEPLATLRVRASAAQADQLLACRRLAKRTRAVESAGGLGHLLAQQRGRRYAVIAAEDRPT
jgi:hypothetical protein